MDESSKAPKDESPRTTPRTSLCLSGPIPGFALHHGDPGFEESLERVYLAPESNAAEQLIQLKTQLRKAGLYEFWTLLMEGVTKITGAQFGFVSKRILVDDEHSAVEMPPIGEPGSCLMGVILYYNDGHGIKNEHRNSKYFAYGAPCGHMKHDKVFLVPERLTEFTKDNQNTLPFPCEAYLGVPLFSDGKCFAHFGLMWTSEGSQARSLGWGYLEMLLHSLEDIIQQRIVDGESFTKTKKLTEGPNHVIPSNAVAITQSLKPYARSLSHELRTPMQGVVGMLDVMHATVQEAVEGQGNLEVRQIFQTLRENIEAVQDSSRRACDAAENVIHAYDLNMEVPDTPPGDLEEVDGAAPLETENDPGKTLVKRRLVSLEPVTAKRQRSEPVDQCHEGPRKRRVTSSSIASSQQRKSLSPRSRRLKLAVREGDELMNGAAGNHADGHQPVQGPVRLTPMEYALQALDHGATLASGFRRTNIREVLHYVINESLRVGGRPESAIAEDTVRGELIEIRTRSPSGEVNTKIIDWSVDPFMPEELLVEDHDLAKLISCVFLNALKFTDRGKIIVTAALSPKSRYLVINVKDTGSGIPKSFLPNLFKPFAREDDSLTRQQEGLGLGLLVAKGLVRKIGGDLICVRSETSGPHRGSEFEIRIPASVAEIQSTPTTRVHTPTPSVRSTAAAEAIVHGKSSAHPAGGPRNGTLAASSDKRRTRRPSLVVKPHSHKGVPSLLPVPPVSKTATVTHRRSPANGRSSFKKGTFDKNLAKRYPLNILVVEDNVINRKLLVNMLSKLGYTNVYEAYNGVEAVRQMSIDRGHNGVIDVILMDLWMPIMDGYEATEKILKMYPGAKQSLTILAVSADGTAEAKERAAHVGIDGFLAKPYKLLDLERLIIEHCVNKTSDNTAIAAGGRSS